MSASHYTPTGLLAEQRAGRGTENFLNAIRDNPHQPPIYGDVQRTFHYNRAQNVVAIEDSRWQLTQYGYNANDQIIETQFSNHYESEYERFKYDANLNLIEYSTVPAEVGQPWLLLSQQQQAGRIVRRGLHQGHQDCYYDRNGRLEKKVVHKNGYRPQEWRYLWNTQNQLTACFTPEGDCWRYVYDAFGRRLSKTKTVDMLAINEKPAFPLSKKRITGWHYLWSGDQMVEETPVYADGTIAYEASIQWLYQPGAITPAARYQHGTLHYVVADHQGTPREMFTEAGMAIWGGRLHTWGKLDIWQVRYGRAEDDPNYIPCNFRFAGQYEDAETGLFYNRFRYYDKNSGQYISPDPIGLLGGFNPYGYVHNPVGWVDPFGLAGTSSIKQTGGRQVLDPESIEGWEKAEIFYKKIRSDPTDIAQIAKNTGNTGWKESHITRIKSHVFFKEHQLDHGVFGKFDADPAMVNAWERLKKGDHIKSDIDLLKHEYFESRFEGIFSTIYRTAHDATIKSGRDWKP